MTSTKQNIFHLNQYEQRASIESNKANARGGEKTQVLTPILGRLEVVKTRQTHSYEVATSSMIIAINIAKSLNLSIHDIDYQGSLENVSLLHDIGHPPFGHDGADMINELFLKLGLKEGFDDNNNNLTCIEKNKIEVSNYVKASLIKYPSKLYASQKGYKYLLDYSIQEDLNHFSQFNIHLKNQERTIACQIMDEADRNSYVCSDLADFFCLGGKINYSQLTKLHSFKDLNEKVVCMIKEMQKITTKSGKSEIKNYFNLLKNKFNSAFGLTNSGIVVIDDDLFAFREFLYSVEYEFFIKPIRKDPFHANNMSMLNDFLNHVIENQYYPSKTYKKLIDNAKTHNQKLMYIRDMVSEVSDWYIVMFHKEFSKNNRNFNINFIINFFKKTFISKTNKNQTLQF